MRLIPVLVLGSLATLSLGQACGPAPSPTDLPTNPPGTILEKIGTTDMPITAKTERAKALCRQGFALIHCYWFHEAIRSFRDAIKEDPTSAIAWCGLNISLTQPWARKIDFQKEADYAIRKAIANIDTASPAEQDLIRAFRLRSFGQDDRDTAFEKSMTKLVETYPKLNEPRLLWAGIRCQLCMWTSYLPNGEVRGDLEFVAKLIEPVLKRDKNSFGALHYGIHAFEPNNPDKAVEYAIRLAKANSTSPHMLHMPGHIFYRVGRYEEARLAFTKAKLADEAFAAKLKVEPRDADWQYGHNVTFLLFDLMEMGRLREALELAKKAGSIEDVYVRQGRWAEATGRRTRSVKDDARRPEEATAWRGLADLAAGNLADAQARLEILQGALKNPSDYGESTSRVMRTVMFELEGQILIAKGQTEEGIRKLRGAIPLFENIQYEEPPLYARPPHESLGYALIQLGRTDEAVKAFQSGLEARPHSGWMLYGIAAAYEKGGQKDKAQDAYTAFLAAWPTADEDLPMVQHAKAFVAQAKRPRRSPPASLDFPF